MYVVPVADCIIFTSGEIEDVFIGYRSQLIERMVVSSCNVNIVVQHNTRLQLSNYNKKCCAVAPHTIVVISYPDEVSRVASGGCGQNSQIN